MTDDDPITLKDAAELYRLTVSTLRAEAGRGRLEIFRLGKRDYTTILSMREMVRKCQDAGRRRVCTSTENEDSGLSETEKASAAQAALSATVVELKSSLSHTSEKSINRSAAHRR